MSSTYISWPPKGVPAYATFSAFPASAADGSLAIAQDTDILYAYNAGSAMWVAIGGPGAVLSVGTIDTGSPSSNGAHITADQLIMQSASASVPGLVNLTTQTFAGNKTFTGTIAASNLSGTNTGDVTLTAVGSSPSANGASLSGQVLTLQPADATHPGLLTILSQTLAGVKTFSSAPIISAFSTGVVHSDSSGNLTSSTIVNADVDAAAAIAFSKLASLTSAHILVGSAGNVATDTAVSGDITITNTGVTAIGANKVTNSQLAQIATATFKGRTTAGTGNVEDLTATQATALLNVFVGDSGSGGTKGLVVAPATGDATKFLRGDATWATPASSGVTTVGTIDTQTKSADGAVISGTSIFMQTADSTHPGLMSTGTQTIAGAKTFSSTITADISGNAGNVTGTVIVSHGGTGQTSNTNHGVLLGQGTNAIVATVAGTSGQLLQSGGASADPTWTTAIFPADAATGDIMYSASDHNWNRLTKSATSALVSDSGGGPMWTSGGTANRLLRTNGTAVSFAQAVLTTDVTGTLPIANGGTNATTKAAAFDSLSPMTTGGDLIYGGASGTGTRLANGSSGNILTSGGGTAAPTWTNGFVPVKYKTAAGQSLSNNTDTVINFDTSVFDPQSTVTTGAAWHFTAPTTGYYFVQAMVAFSTNSGGTRDLLVKVNGSTASRLNFQGNPSATANTYVRGSTGVQLTAGDTVDIHASQDSGGSLTLSADGNNNYVTIFKIG